MAVITLTSATGAPGVTTTALGLALQWPRDVLLADCDRDPSQALQAGWLHGVELGGRGLGPLASVHREQRHVGEELWLQTVSLLPTGEADGHDQPNGANPPGSKHVVERRFLPGFSHPAASGLFLPVWQDFVDACVALGASGTDVLIDAGRIGREGLPAALVAGSDLLLVCVRSSLRSLAALQLHLPTLQSQVEAMGCATRIELLVVGAGRPYVTAEVERQFAVPVAHAVAWDPRQAAVLSDGEARSWAARPRRGGALVRSHRAGASRLAERVQRRSEVVAGTRSSGEWSA